MTGQWLMQILLIVFCLGLSSLLSGMETGVFALSRLRIRNRMRAGQLRARLLHRYLENMENFLWVILVGNTVANVLAMSLVAVAILSWLGDHPLRFIPVWFAILFLFYSFGDFLPKTLFRMYPNRLTLIMVRPFRWLNLALWPLVTLVAWFANGLLRWTGGRTFQGRLFGNRDELRWVMQESTQSLTDEERTMITRVLDWQKMNVSQIMLPWKRVVAVAMTTPMREAMDVCREKGLTRLPVYNETRGSHRVEGIISLKAVLFADDLDLDQQVADHMKPALFFEQNHRLDLALQKLQRTGRRIAVVLDANGNALGLVSLQDILKVIFGEVSL